ncbi:sulfate anion transporter 1 isoform X2 [Xiphias gladius]|uniref:sulfate anion transporter 1 isoform X2 n=1 Tax=Xiphias gladius TaxID=8245 RepID=UPI001A9983FF|nr:sulfate anion transporter 1 isoform X2 [Xiphias gladius]
MRRRHSGRDGRCCLQVAFKLLLSGNTADHSIHLPSLFLSPCCLLFLLKTMEEVTKITETTPTPPPLLERRVRQRQPIVSVLKSKLKQGVTCSLPRVRSTLTGFFPVVQWLPKYKLREYVWGDAMSGLIVGIILVPQAIAYCLLAGVEPIYGLYTSFYANIIYFFMGTSRHVSVGIFSLMSLMVGQLVDREMFLAGFDLNEDSKTSGPDVFNGSMGTNLTASKLHTVELMGLQCGKECYAISIAAAVTFLAGVYQAKYLLGLKIPRHQGYATVVVTWINIFANIHKTNLCDLITSAICISILVAGKEIQERYKDRLKIPLPTELVVVAGATLASHFGGLSRIYGSSVSGHIPTGFIPPQVPSFCLMSRVAMDAIPLAVISFAFTVSLSEMFAKKNGYTVRPNQEMLAIGFCNIIPSFFHCFTTSAALAKTMVKDSTGCQTQVSSLISALVVLLVLLFFAPFFYSLQKCVLACIIIVSLRGALRKFKDVPDKWHASRNDTIVWLVTMSATALISVELGLLVGIAFSLICIIFQTQNPKVSLLGRANHSDLYEDVEEYKNLMPPPRVQVFRFQAPLYFANKESFLKSLYKAVGVEPLLEMTTRRKAEKKAKQMSSKQANGDKKNGEVVVGLVQRELEFHTIVLDCSAIPFIDSTGMATFKGLVKEYKEIGVSLLLASCNTSVIDTLQKGQFFGKNDKDMSSLLFHTVHTAVLYANRTSAAAESQSDDSEV